MEYYAQSKRRRARIISHRVANLYLIDHTSIIHNFLIFIQNLLKLSLTWFSYYSASIETNLFWGWTFPLIIVFTQGSHTRYHAAVLPEGPAILITPKDCQVPIYTLVDSIKCELMSCQSQRAFVPWWDSNPHSWIESQGNKPVYHIDHHYD